MYFSLVGQICDTELPEGPRPPIARHQCVAVAPAAFGTRARARDGGEPGQVQAPQVDQGPDEPSSSDRQTSHHLPGWKQDAGA